MNDNIKELEHSNQALKDLGCPSEEQADLLEDVQHKLAEEGNCNSVVSQVNGSNAHEPVPED